jgi:hypothetical protein
MPFVSKAQQRAAFSGALGPEMKSKAETWARETPDIKALPERVAPKKRGRKLNVKRRRDVVMLK